MSIRLSLETTRGKKNPGSHVRDERERGKGIYIIKPHTRDNEDPKATGKGSVTIRELSAAGRKNVGDCEKRLTKRGRGKQHRNLEQLNAGCPGQVLGAGEC